MRNSLLLSLCVLAALSCSKKNDDPAQPASPGGGGGGGGTTPCTYTVGPWSAWAGGIRTREVTAEPVGCTGTAPQAIQYHSCYTGDRGWLKITNLSSNPYRVTITGPTGWPPMDLNGGYMFDSLLVDVGTYGLHSLQLSGYIFTPSEFNTTVTVQRCQVRTWSFP